MHFKILIVLQILLLSHFGLGLDEESAKEGKCIEPDVSKVDLNYDWVFSHSRWYFPILSRLEMYRTVGDLLQEDVKTLTEDKLSSACLIADWSGMTPKIIGFGDKELSYDFTPFDDNVFIFGAPWREGDGGKTYLAKTDNKSYILFVKCWDDDNTSWNVMSVEKTLSPEAKEEILSELKSLGINVEMVTPQDYSGCDIQEPKTEL